MNRRVMHTFRSMGVYFAVGAAVGAFACHIMRDQKHLQKKAGKAAHAVSEFVDNIHHCICCK